VPYPEGYEVENGGPSQALRDLQAQADAIVERLDKDGVKCASDREIVALIAYLQRLGTDFTSTQEP
jgi:cytochrome c oxidase cbb3-type subunit I/II